MDEAAELLVGQVTRRAFLGAAGASVLAGAAGAARTSRLVAPAGSDASTPRVVIVGSGIAGLGCAYRLWASRGIRPEVYEFNTVPGGSRSASTRRSTASWAGERATSISPASKRP